MRMQTYFWGVSFVPESTTDVEVLKQLPNEADNHYEDGSGALMAQADLPIDVDGPFPMGVAFVIDR